MLRRTSVLLFSLLICFSLKAQLSDRAPVQVGPLQVLTGEKVGVVLSGGGASGLAHIGVLKALEENNIPIDYICGTSMGALVGCLYAQGLTPVEIETLVKSEEFLSWATGNVQPDNIYYFKKKEDDASWVTFKLNLDTALSSNLPTNLISPVQLDFALMERTAAAAAAANYNFDSLFIPFRCVASDVAAKQSVIFKEGDLGEALRASMSYPFYLKPISVNGKLLYDGGLYNNFPSDVMYRDFFPDFIIGSNVASEFQNPDEDNLISQIRAMLTSKTDFDAQCENGIIVEPDADWLGLFDFVNAQRIIDSGYVATMRKMDTIRMSVVRRSDPAQLTAARAAFIAKQPKIIFDNITIEGTGLKKRQVAYVSRLLRHREQHVSIDDLKPGYFRLAADDKIKTIFPRAHYNRLTGYYDLKLTIKKEKNVSTSFGGNFSNRPINMGYVGFRYNILNNPSISISGNGYFGKLYSSGQARARVDFPFRLPLYLEPMITWNRWDYYRSSSAFFEDTKPPFLVNIDRFAEIDLGFPVRNKGRFVIGTGFAANRNLYYQTDIFSSSDTADKTDFNLITTHILYERNTLNRKQFASAGTYFAIRARFVQGEEFYEPGSTAIVDDNFRTVHNWLQFRLTYDTYFKERGSWRLGYLAELVYTTQPFSNQPFFHNYISTILNAPAFEPTPESKTYFIPDFRAHQFLGTGVKSILVVAKNIEWRVEGYIFAPYQKIVQNINLTASYASPPAFNFQYIKTLQSMAMTAFVWHTPLGPLSLSLNYYSPRKQPFSLLFNFGYIIFNRKTMD